MNMDKSEESGITSKNPLLRKIAQLELAAARNMEEVGAEGPLKSGLDLLRDDIIADTIARHPEATREKILQGMIDMGF
jgi:hypothetical protein